MLPRGNYKVTASKTGFKLAVRSEVNLDEGQVLRLDLALETGEVKEVVEEGNNGVQDWDNLRAERSISVNDLPQRLVLTALYDLPFGKDGHPVYKALAGLVTGFALLVAMREETAK